MPPKPTRNHVLNRTVKEVRAIGDQLLWLRFDDGAEGELDLRTFVPFENLYADFEDPRFVARVWRNEWGTVEWPNGIEFDATVLYCTVTGAPLPTFDEPPPRPRSRGSRPRTRRAATNKMARKFPRSGSRKRRR